jgi:hypothetical protein
MNVVLARMSHTLERAKARLLDAARRAKPQAMFDAGGYSLRLEDNLVEGVSRNEFEADYVAAAGQELGGKMRAVHSSAALVVNTFALWRKSPSTLFLADVTGFSALRFEVVFPTGLGGTSPHLDLVAYGPAPIAVESKCLEYLTPKTPVFSRSYDTITDARRDSPWFGLIDLLRTDPERYRHLDVAQLVKHALGLMRAPVIEDVTLLYLYWEPLNHADFAEFQSHREEIASVQTVLEGAKPMLRSISYAEMWAGWRKRDKEKWLNTHLDRLHERYAVVI